MASPREAVTRAKWAACAVFGAILFVHAALGFPGRLVGRGMFANLLNLDQRQWGPSDYAMMAAGVILVLTGVVWRWRENKWDASSTR